MLLKGYTNGRLVHVNKTTNKDQARNFALRWGECDAFRYGRKFYSPSQIYGGMYYDTDPAEFGLTRMS